MEQRIFQFDEDLAADLKAEYRTLLGLGVDDDVALEKIIAYFEPNRYGYSYETTFWLTLAEAQWRFGRLDEEVKGHAFHALEELNRSSIVIGDSRAVSKIQAKLLQPMPPKKKVRKPTVYQCPWTVGTLLAYRIVNNEDLADHPCFMKYVLLRVVNIKRRPVSSIMPSALYDESLYVSVYDWIGDQLPNPKLADTLDFVPIFDADYWVIFDWVPTKFEKADITVVGYDSEYHPPEYLNFQKVPYCITGCYPFDNALAKRFLPKMQQNGG